jgi:hypothetical protein
VTEQTLGHGMWLRVADDDERRIACLGEQPSGARLVGGVGRQRLDGRPAAPAQRGGEGRDEAGRGSDHERVHALQDSRAAAGIPADQLGNVCRHMPLPIGDYALIGDTQTAALVGRDGSIDWLCLPRFDSPACFAALLGDESHGRWLLAPTDDVQRVERRYRPGTLVLETDFHTRHGVLQIVDSMPIRDEAPDVVRVARCL